MFGLRFFIISATLTITGCATVSQKPITATPVTITGVVFFPQTEDQCGPSALASLLTYSGIQTSPQALRSEIYTPSLKGSLPPELLASTRKHGRIPYLLPNNSTALIRSLSTDHPVLILQDVGLITPIWHYAVIYGYLPDRLSYILYSGDQQKLFLSEKALQKTWGASQYWGFIILNADEIPPWATDPSYLQSVADWEPEFPLLAQTAYLTGQKHWPNNTWSLMGLGNIAYQQKNYSEALNWFYRGSQTQPHNPDFYNNLAMTYLQQHKIAQAKQAIQTALTLGGPHQPIYTDTLDHIEHSQ